MSYTVAVVGATGNVGHELLNILSLDKQMRSTECSLESVGLMHKGDVFLFKYGARILAAVAGEFFWLEVVNVGSVVVHCRLLRHGGGTAYSHTTEEAYVYGDKVVVLVPYFSWQPGVIHIVAGADFLD